jgi:putative DNA primase/helicase
MPLTGSVLGIGEGVETVLSAHALVHDRHASMRAVADLGPFPVWAALNTSLLATFDPPESVTDLIVFADADVGGLSAALTLVERLQGRVRFRVLRPRDGDDWNDVHIRRLK